MPEGPPAAPTGDELLKVLSALGNPHRLRIVAALLESRTYVSALARLIGMGRPLLHMHLQRLEAAGLIVGTLEAGEDGKSMKYYDVTPFLYELTPHVVAQAAATLTETTGPGRAADRGATEEAK
ncbi:ArsR/SmtB family transcription factor [Streptomyces olivaceus]|uniref:ArsR/SmtB family transcription factor n=1 Tax=Streptomyces olivaceus TaxID=47716 RepID=UPI00087800A1|nr:transcriptional regulator [Streptomyces olivaceus]